MTKSSKTKVSTTTQKISLKVKNHPNEWKYCGRSGYEYNIAQMKFLSSLSEIDSEKLSNPDKIIHEKLVNEFHSSLKINDEIGIGYNLYTVKQLMPNGINVLKNKDTEESFLSLKDIDYNIGFDFSEILKRDGQLFNTKNTIEVNLKIIEKKSKNEPKQKFIH